jgi:hypothetical protein
MKKLLPFLLIVLLAFVLSSRMPGVDAQSSGGIDSTAYSRLSKAILLLDQKVKDLQGKGSEEAMQQQLAKVQNDIASLRQQLVAVSVQEAANRRALLQLHERLTALDGKNSTIQLSE